MTAATAPARSAGAATAARRRAHRRLAVIPWLFLVPGVILALLFKLYPMAEGVRLSLFKVQPFLGDLFVGAENYLRVSTDPRFLTALGHTVVLAVIGTIGALVIGGLLALLLEGSGTVLAIVRTSVFLPVVTAVAVIGEVWRVLYFPTDTGLLNALLGLVGVPTQQFLGNPAQALGWVVVVDIWTAAPYDMVIILAGLAGIDRELYEAAAVDGATIRQRLRYIVIPGLRASLSVVLTLAAIRSLRTFTLVYVLTGGGPAGATDVWMTRVYDVGFQTNDTGLASAACTVLLVATLVLTVGTRLLTNRSRRDLG